MTGSGGWWRILDERNPRGGRLKAWLFLTHPGPSLLVTAVTVAAAGLLLHRLPSARVAVGLALVMLPAQLAIGALNDWADVAADAASKPFKPLARGLVSRQAAALAAVAGFAVSLATAAWLGAAPLLVALLGAGAGAAYDLGLKRGRLATLAWAGGFLAVPLLAMVVTGRLEAAPGVVPLAVLTALALQLANGLPDVAGDRRAGIETLAVALDRRARGAAAALLLGAAACVAGLAIPLHQDRLVVVAVCALALAGAAAGLAQATRLVFPVTAVLVAIAAVSWLAALPGAAA